MRLIILPLFGLIALFSTGCSTVPETGRKQFLSVHQSQVASLAEQMLPAFVIRSGGLSTDAAKVAKVQKIGDKIIRYGNVPSNNWRFFVVGDTRPGAFSLGGGIVVINDGMVDFCRNDDELAAVIGHEIAHDTCRHLAERHSRNALAGSLIQMASRPDYRGQVQARNNDRLYRDLMATAHSRQQEKESDYVGMKYMARAGYDPREQYKIWKRFGHMQVHYLNTHPTNQERGDAGIENIAEALVLYNAAKARGL